MQCGRRPRAGMSSQPSTAQTFRAEGGAFAEGARSTTALEAYRQDCPAANLSGAARHLNVQLPGDGRLRQMSNSDR